METVIILILILVVISLVLKGESNTFSDYTPPTPKQLSTYVTNAQKKEHMQSEYWKNLKQKRWEIAGGVCERCKQFPCTDLHHLHYQNLLEEDISEVVYLCRACHQHIHDKFGYSRHEHFPIHGDQIPPNKVKLLRKTKAPEKELTP